MTARRAAAAAGVLAVLALAVLGLVRAATPAGRPSLQDRVHAVATTLRCPTCQGLSVADSTSVTATGSRQIIQQQLQEGRSPDQIRQWFVDRYGEQVLLSPAASGPGLLAWGLPMAGVVAGGLLVWRWLRRGRGARAPAAGGAADPAADPAAVAALADFHAGRLDPDGTPAGEALREALVARIAAGEDGADAAVVGSADRRLAAASARYAARSVPAPGRPAEPVPARPLPRRALTVAAAAAVLLAAGFGVGAAVTRGGRGTASAATAAATSSPAPAPMGAGLPSVPAGWTGGMPKDAPGWVSLGRAYDQAEQYEQAVAAYTMALRLQPGADAVSLMRDDVLVRSGHPDQALPDLRQLGARYPDNPDVLLVLGLAQNRTGSPDAPATLRHFLTLAPDSPAAPGVRKLLGDG